MPQEVQNGSAIVFGISNSGSPIAIQGTAHFIVDMAKGTHKFKVESIEDENGFDTSLVATNAHMELDITFVPSARTATSGGTRADAYAVAVFLDPLAKVTLENFKVAAFN